MKYDDFVGEAIARLDLPSRAKGVRAIRATLSTLGERLTEGEAEDLAGALPMEIDYYVTHVEHEQRFNYEEFMDRVAEKGDYDRSDAVFYAKAIVDLVGEAVPEGQFEDLQAVLPDDYEELFELTEVESERLKSSEEQ